MFLSTLTIIGRSRGTIFIRIPAALAEPCGPCSCDYCKAHPQETPKWDALSLSQETGEFAHRVHLPDPSVLRNQMRRDADAARRADALERAAAIVNGETAP